MSDVPEKLADLIHEVLVICYVKSRDKMTAEIIQNGWSLEQLVAMALAEGIRERFKVSPFDDDNEDFTSLQN